LLVKINDNFVVFIPNSPLKEFHSTNSQQATVKIILKKQQTQFFD